MQSFKIYYYVHTGHRIGLDRFRRATTILRALKDEDIALLLVPPLPRWNAYIKLNYIKTPNQK